MVMMGTRVAQSVLVDVEYLQIAIYIYCYSLTFGFFPAADITAGPRHRSQYDRYRNNGCCYLVIILPIYEN